MPTISQTISTFGFAPVIAFTRKPVAEPESAAAAARATRATRATRTRGAAAAVRVGAPSGLASLLRCFTEHEDSQIGALDAAAASSSLGAAGQRAGRAKAGASRSRGAEAAPAPTARVYGNLGVVYGTVDNEGLAALRADPQVTKVRAAPQLSLIRPVVSGPAKLTTANTWGIDALGVPELWAAGLSGAGVRVAHLDTGIDATHPALAAALAAYQELDKTGRPVPNAVARDSDTNHSHGTHTAATIAGRAVAGRRVGVAPGAELYSAMVIEGGDIVARILGGMDWAVGEGVRVLSMSLGIREYREDFLDLIDVLRDSAILPVIAVGNEGPGTSRSPGNYPRSLSVGAHDEAFAVAGFSSSQRFVRRSQQLVPDIMAPGVGVISAAAGGGWRTLSGSSMAVPHVAGLAALLLEAHPTTTVAKLERAIQSSAAIGTMNAERANRGAVNAVRALAELTA